MQSDMEFQIHNLEQIAYGAVLRAFQAQSDALSWEKEGLITDLRRELRMSDDEHRELLSKVNSDDLIHRIKEWRKVGGSQNLAPVAPQHLNNQLPSRKPRPSQSLHPHSMAATMQPLSSGIGGRRPNVCQPGLAPARRVQYQPVDDPSESTRDPLVGRKVMIRWPEDNNFYEAIITDFNPVDGRHSLAYDISTPNETSEWVPIREFPPEDIRWVDDDRVIQGPGAPNPVRERRTSGNQSTNEIRPSGNGVVTEDLGEIEIFHTDMLIEKVEKVLHASHPDELKIANAKKLLKEHEQTLIQVIAKLADVCDSSGNEDIGEADMSV